MPTFRIIYNNKEEEDVVATSHSDIKSWLVFIREDGPLERTEILRVKAAHVRRVELIEEPPPPTRKRPRSTT